jgi:prolyl 4-hydroxylase
MKNNYILLNDTPLIKKWNNFLSKEECQELIEYGKQDLRPGRIVSNTTGDSMVDYAHRNASVSAAKNPELLLKLESIRDKISEHIGMDKSRFENCVITNYSVGQSFKRHPDYFQSLDTETHKKATQQRCKMGGNRISTIILYLNDVIEGGETYFPWINLKIKAEQSNMIQFDYGYEDFMNNLRSEHVGMPVLEGEKWIITVWIREQPLTQAVDNFKIFSKEVTIYESLTDSEFELECGPEYDRKTLHIDLPANNNPTNDILVGFTGGMDSCLLLYLLGALNNLQVIPYRIIPIFVTNDECRDTVPLLGQEDRDNVNLMRDIIFNKIDGNITRVAHYPAPPKSIDKNFTGKGLKRFFDKEWPLLKDKVYAPKAYDAFRFRNFSYIYTGANEPIKDDTDKRWENAYKPITLSDDALLPFKLPFRNLLKYHIVDAIIQLGLEEIFENSSVCSINHSSLDDCCIAYQCNERRWAFSKLGKDLLGDKYLLNKGIKL